MMKRKILLALCMLIAIGSCTKKQDLVHKAFEDKNFDAPTSDRQTEDPLITTEEPEVEDENTKTEVLVDNIAEPPEETVYMETGKPERPRPSFFKKDPEAPIFNLEDAKLYDIVHMLCELMEVNFIIDPSVKDQTITISMVESDERYTTSQLFDLILKLHDLTMVWQGGFVYILPISAPDVNPGLDLLYGSKPNPNLRAEELSIQLIPLKYVTPADMGTVIKEFLSPSARVYEEPKSNILIVIDKQLFVSKVMNMIPIFDVDVLHNKKMVFYQLAHVDAVETAGKLEEILGVYGYESGGDRLSLVPIETLNGILAVSSAKNIFTELDFWIAKFDKEARYEEEQVFIYQVENTTAYNISNTLSQLFGLRTGSGGGGRGSTAASNRRTTNPNLNQQDPNNRQQNQQQQIQQQNDPRRQQQINQSNDPNAPILIVDEDNNSLIFMTTPREYTRILKTLKKLDVLPRQVFLEVTVLSVTLDDTFNLGINWGFQKNALMEGDTRQDLLTGGTGIPRSADGTALGDGLSGGYSFTGLTGVVQASINAAKTKGYANVLQQPHIMAIDNKQASISVGDDVPIRTTSTNLNSIAGGNSTTPASSSTIQYRQTGVNLAFTPHINANGVIRLEVALDISEPGAPGPDGAPPIQTRALQTEMIVRDDQTVIMGGLILNQEGWGNTTVPLLGRIPILKHLFSKRNSNGKKTELVVMITPRLIDSEEKSIEISKEFKEKILKEFESFRTDR